MLQNSTDIVFRDRQEAGRILANCLEYYRERDPVVMALPRGGVAVGYEIAIQLKARLDVLIARKLGAPVQPELAIGAIAPENVLLVDNDTLRYLAVTEDQFRTIVEKETREMYRREAEYHKNIPPANIENKTVIVVDDGLATGMTARAAIYSIRNRNANEIVLAIPVSAIETAEQLSSIVDYFVCISQPVHFRAVGSWYRNFDQLDDNEVIGLLNNAYSEFTKRA